MSDQSNQDPLEDFFHKHLDNYGDEPGADFWEKLEDQIPPPPEKKKRFLAYWLLGLGLLVGFVLYHQHRIQALETVIAAQQEALELKSEGFENANANVEVVAEPNDFMESNASSSSTKVARTNSSSNTNSDAIAGGMAKPRILEGEWKEKGPLSEELEGVVVLKEEVEARAEEEIAINTNNNVNGNIVNSESKLIPALASKAIFAEYHGLENEASKHLILPKFSPLFEIGLFYEQWLWTREAGKDLNTSFNGKSKGLALGLHLSPRWRLQSGIGWANVTVNSIANTELEFREEGAELNDKNTLFNDYNYFLPTGLGPVSYNSSIGFELKENPAENIKDGEIFSISVSQQDRLDYLYIPLHIIYQSLDDRKWRWELGLGLDFYQLLRVQNLDNSLSVIHFDESRFVVEDSKVSLNSQLQNLHNSFIGARLSGGLNRKITARWSLGLQAYYQHGLSAVSQDKKLHVSGLRLGTQYQF